MAHTDPHRPDAPAEPPVLNHEPTDADLGSVERIIVGLVVLLGVAFLLMWILFGLFSGREDRLDTPPTALVQEQRERDTRQPLERFPAPRLQEQPYEDIQMYLRSQERVLQGYGWVDRQKGIVHIPIERAMEIVAERGLPPVTGPPTPVTEQPGAPATPPLVPEEATGAGARPGERRPDDTQPGQREQQRPRASPPGGP
jgi:hypothetical protein